MAINCPRRQGGFNRHGNNHSNTGTSSRAQVNVPVCSTVQCVPDCAQNDVMNECDVPTAKNECECAWEYSEFPVVEAMSVCALPQGKVKISPLRFLSVNINGKAVRALKDSLPKSR